MAIRAMKSVIQLEPEYFVLFEMNIYFLHWTKTAIKSKFIRNGRDVLDFSPAAGAKSITKHFRDNDIYSRNIFFGKPSIKRIVLCHLAHSVCPPLNVPKNYFTFYAFKTLSEINRAFLGKQFLPLESPFIIIRELRHRYRDVFFSCWPSAWIKCSFLLPWLGVFKYIIHATALARGI